MGRQPVDTSVLSVWFQNKMRSWDRKFTYHVRDVLPSPIICVYSLNALSFSDMFTKETVIPLHTRRSRLALTLVASRPEDAFLTSLLTQSLANNIIYRSQYRVPDPIFNRVNNINHFLSVFWSKHLFNVWTFNVFSMVVEILSQFLTVNSRSTVSSLNKRFCSPLFAVSPKISSWTKSSTWLRSLFFCCFFRVETMVALTSELHI